MAMVCRLFDDKNTLQMSEEITILHCINSYTKGAYSLIY